MSRGEDTAMDFSIVAEVAGGEDFGIAAEVVTDDDFGIAAEVVGGSCDCERDDGDFSIAADVAPALYYGGRPEKQTRGRSKRALQTRGKSLAVNRVAFAANMFAANPSAVKWYGKTRGQIFEELGNKYLPTSIAKKELSRCTYSIFSAYKRLIRAFERGETNGVVLPYIEGDLLRPDIIDQLDLTRPAEVRELATSIIRAATNLTGSKPKKLPRFVASRASNPPSGRSDKWTAFIAGIFAELERLETFYIELLREVVDCTERCDAIM